MPTYDFRCRSAECPMLDVRFESLLKHWDDPNPSCPGCHQELERLIAAPNLGWITKPYTDLDLKEDHVASGNYCPDGIWVTRRATSRRVDGKPEQDLIKTRAEYKEFCKRENYIFPEDLPPNLEIDRDGKTLRSSGHAGQWI